MPMLSPTKPVLSVTVTLISWVMLPHDDIITVHDKQTIGKYATVTYMQDKNSYQRFE